MTSSKEPPTMDDLAYEWPPNLLDYEAHVLWGLTALEGLAGGMALLLPLALLGVSAGSFLLAVILAPSVLLTVKKWEQLGEQSLPSYLLLRLLARRQQRVLELPLIMAPADRVPLHVESDAGETLFTME